MSGLPANATPAEIAMAVLGLWQLGFNTAEIADDLGLDEPAVLEVLEEDRAERRFGRATPAGSGGGTGRVGS